MLFNSFEFLFFFLPVSLIVYFLLNRMRLAVGANSWLLFVSLFFYSWWNVAYLPLILASILFNYTIGGLLAETKERRRELVSKKAIFVAGLLGNILFLGYFKYMDFFIGNINGLFATNIPLLHIVLPLGISFFTITQIAFLVDAYEGLVKERNLLNYALFVTFFPHLLAGPILHHKEMMPQFAALRNKAVNYRHLSAGLLLFLIGFLKKVAIADNLAPLADNGFANPAMLTLLESWVSVLSYTLQIYFDFSGYSDMAIGIGWMFNIALPVNFNSPYKAASMIDFWKRWHMTLSRFITTYLYSPILRGTGNINLRNSLIAIFLAMFISGVWHGAGWTFVLWGTAHGAALVVNHLWRNYKLPMTPLLGRLLTMLFIIFSFVIFRAKSLMEALSMYKAMFGFNGVILPRWLAKIGASLSAAGVTFGKMFENIDGKGEVYLMLIMLIFAMTAKNSMAWADRRSFRPGTVNFLIIIALVFIDLLFLNSIQSKEFLYFDF